MKIKRSFVTNSSSCSYLTYIPKGSIDKNQLWVEKIINVKVKNMIEYLERGNNLYSSKGYDEYENEELNDPNNMEIFGEKDFNLVLKILESLNFPLYFDEDGSDGVFKLENIADSKFGKQIRKFIEKELEKKNGTTD